MTITLTREEAQQLLEVFELFLEEAEDVTTLEDNLVKMLRARLSAPEPEPVAWQSRMRPDWEENGWTQWKDCPKEQADNFWKTPRLHDWVYEARALYTAPPQREWQGLTDEDLSVCDEDGVILARYWEAKLRERNT